MAASRRALTVIKKPLCPGILHEDTCHTSCTREEYCLIIQVRKEIDKEIYDEANRQTTDIDPQDDESHV